MNATETRKLEKEFSEAFDLFVDDFIEKIMLKTGFEDKDIYVRDENGEKHLTEIGGIMVFMLITSAIESFKAEFDRLKEMEYA